MLESKTSRQDPVHQIIDEYSGDAERPLIGYVGLMVTFVTLFIGFLALVRSSNRQIPDRFNAGDLTLVGIATFHLGRIIAKSGITSPLRAPFTRFRGASETPAELSESVRPSGFRHAVGELLTCPFCVSLWVAAFFSYGLVLAPRVTRLIASIFTIDAISDSLNLLYDALANVLIKTPDLLEQKTDRST